MLEKAGERLSCPSGIPQLPFPRRQVPGCSLTFGVCPFFPFFSTPARRGVGSSGKGPEAVPALSRGLGVGTASPSGFQHPRHFGGLCPCSPTSPAAPSRCPRAGDIFLAGTPRSAGFVWQSLGEDEPGGYWELPRLQLDFPIQLKLQNSINTAHRPNQLTRIWGKLSPSPQLLKIPGKSAPSPGARRDTGLGHTEMLSVKSLIFPQLCALFLSSSCSSCVS